MNDAKNPQLMPSEIEDDVLKIADSEVQVEKVLSEEELKRIEAERLEAEARGRGKKDDSAERGLVVMMDGKLEEDDSKVARPFGACPYTCLYTWPGTHVSYGGRSSSSPHSNGPSG